MFGEHRPPNQERRASARRGSVTGRACRAERIMFGEQTTESGAAGVSPPWFCGTNVVGNVLEMHVH